MNGGVVGDGPMSGKFSHSIAQPFRLLFVDDDPILREFALVHLASEQNCISVAADGREALAAIRRAAPDLVLLDLKMPQMDGFEVLHALRAEPATQRLPIVVITGRDDEASIDQAFSEGATSFIVKPINWQLLAYHIRFVDRARRTELSLVDSVEEIKRRQQELQEMSTGLAAALRAAAAASEAKSNFLSAMSHELRTPLNAIIGFSQILGNENFGPLGNARYREYAHDILDSGSHLLALINDVLEYSCGTAAIEENEFSLSDVLDEAVGLVSGQAKAAEVELSVAPVPDAAWLRADRRRIRQVLLNLLSNAVKFTPAGGQIVVSFHRDFDGLAISIADDGIGIAGNDIDQVLEPFGQVEGSETRKYDGGVGLGLPLAKQVVELHGGRLLLQSNIDIGTTVTIILPKSRIISQMAGLPIVVT